MRMSEDTTVRTPRDDRHATHGGRGGPGWGRFARHYLEMVVAMVVGMLVLGTVLHGVLALAGLDFSSADHPGAALWEMTFAMSAGMAVWMRMRGHGWPSTFEMCGAMAAPAAVLLPLFWLGVIGAGSLMVLDHVLMLPLMFLVMLRRRDEYGA